MSLPTVLLSPTPTGRAGCHLTDCLNSFVFGSNSGSVISSLQSKSAVYALSLNNVTNDYVRSWVNTGFYETVPTPQALSTKNGAGLDLSNQINSGKEEEGTHS